MADMAVPEALPSEYVSLSPQEMDRRICAARSALGKRLVILGHHYQRDKILRYADFTGDSLKLSQLAAGQSAAEFVVFCGVHFMAESADILSRGGRAIILPDLSAGCPMADMADADGVQTALEELSALAEGAAVVPVTYVNSSASAKAVTGRWGGACCTSSNCRQVFQWALASRQGQVKILAVPDQHLARATALDLGYGLEDCVLYRPSLPSGGLTAAQVRRARFILWDGWCCVHQEFTVQQVAQRREQYPGIRVIVHPECDIAVVQAADEHGSTEQIIHAVAAAAPASQWAVGTEANLVNRLARHHADRLIVNLSQRGGRCATMARIDLPHLCWVLDNLAAGKIVNRVQVGEAIRREALSAVERMVQL
jgi:quinolinate synthase